MAAEASTASTTRTPPPAATPAEKAANFPDEARGQRNAGEREQENRHAGGEQNIGFAQSLPLLNIRGLTQDAAFEHRFHGLT